MLKTFEDISFKEVILQSRMKNCWACCSFLQFDTLRKEAFEAELKAAKLLHT